MPSGLAMLWGRACPALLPGSARGCCEREVLACRSRPMERRCRCVVASGTIAEWAAAIVNGPEFT